jgi:polar amino acid transport system substrate-binding protein
MFLMSSHLRRCTVLVLVATLLGASLLSGGTHAHAAPSSGRVIRVAIKPLEPFVAKRSDGSYNGFSIDLWDEVARRNGWSTEYVWNDTVTDLLQQVQERKVDAGIAGISMTQEREAKVDFSYPMFTSGLQVMVPATSASTWRDTLGRVFSPSLFKLLGLVLLVLFLAGHFVWIFNRKREDYPSGYVKGVAEGMWWAGTSITSNEATLRPPLRAWSRAITMLWIIAGIVSVANLTATISSGLTVKSIEGKIKGIDDVYGKRVVTVKGTTAAAELALRGIDFIERPAIADAYAMLASKQADAVVFDAPVLLYRASHAGKGKERVVGSIFRPEPYGIALPNDSELREQIDATLLALNTDGTYSTLYNRYFSPSSG